MDKEDFYIQTTHMLEEIGLQMTAYGIDSELDKGEAKQILTQLATLHRRFGIIVEAHSELERA